MDEAGSRMMKLVFPDSDRPQVLLEPRLYRIGSAPDADVVLGVDGVELLHCELQVGAPGVQLRVPGGVPVRVNDRPVEGLIALRAGDTVDLGAARIRLLAAAESPGANAAAARNAEVADRNATMVRPVLPKFVLRGLSGDHFGRSFPLQTSLTIGRADDAGLRIPLESISRLHARLTPAGDEVLVEDLGSANGTWLNGKRITRAQAVHGDEIRVDTQRFQLVEPGRPLRATAEGAPATARWPWLVALLLAAACAAYWWLR
jgi:pSer/pThr/pTyr-binding forkhead associated (FHA) protein